MPPKATVQTYSMPPKATVQTASMPPKATVQTYSMPPKPTVQTEENGEEEDMGLGLFGEVPGELRE